jgi:hypothetical protein
MGDALLLSTGPLDQPADLDPGDGRSKIDLSAVLQAIRDDALCPLFNLLHGCMLEIGISTEALAAALAENFGILDRVVGPRELCAVALAVKRDGN